MMDMKEEMMSEAVDDVMDEEDEEEEGDKFLKQVLDEIGVDLSQQVRGLARITVISTYHPVSVNGSTNWHRYNYIPSRK